MSLNAIATPAARKLAREKGIETVGSASKRAARKRKVVDDDDDDDEDDEWEDEDDEEVVSNGVHKKVRIS